MVNIDIDFNSEIGKIKPMHAVNNGPVYKYAPDQRITNVDSYREAGIPYARTHDAAFYEDYGGEHIVDVHAIFPNFESDPYAPQSYDFELTDDYLKMIEMAGTKVFYRLGSKIEHWPKKYGTLPPKDFKKWAVICEHIIRHYNEGWANGFFKNIEYWEIWNEPNLDPDDSTHKKTWGGTKLQFFEFYHVAATHLKQCFPNLKIGGPALAIDLQWAEDFLSQLKAPLDFFSWHTYSTDPREVSGTAEQIRALLDRYGFSQAENILDEWNYVADLEGDGWIRSLKTEKSLKGASFIAGTMCMCQSSSLDMLMYYDARPCAMNGMYNTDLVCECLKGYYPFKMFNTLYTLGRSAEVSCEGDNLYACAARNDGNAAVMVTHYCDEDATLPEEIKLNIQGFSCDKGVKAQFYLLDETHDLTLVREEILSGQRFSVFLTAPLFSSYLITLTKI